MELLGYVDRIPDIAWLRALLTFALSVLLIPVLVPFARRFGLVDTPGGRKDHEGAIPVIGGVGIFLAMALSFLLFEPMFPARTLAVGCAAGLLVAVGLADDRFDLSWKVRIGAQVTAALLMYFVADVRVERLKDVFGFAGADIGLLALPFTVFVVVGVINALNMADGIDGLAGSLSMVSILLFASFAAYAGDYVGVVRLLALAGAVAGFLFWNFRWPWQPRARVFLGNGGAMLLGLAIAWMAVRLGQNAEHPVSPVLGPWTIALPLMDCVALMFRRWHAGRSPFSADRGHMHHLMIDAGFGVVSTVLILASISFVLGFGAALAVKAGIYRPLLVLVFLAMLFGWYLFSRDPARAVARLARWRRALFGLNLAERTAEEPVR